MAPVDPPPPTPGGVVAFFDLDKTVIAKASMVAFSRPLNRAGLVSKRTLLRAAWAQLVYVRMGASAEKLERLRESVLRLTTGWDQHEIAAIVRDTLEEVIEPIIYSEALELIEEHRRAGDRIVIISASPEEVVAPIAQRLGAHEAIATRAELDAAGRYSGRTERYVYGPEKALAARELAARDGVDLARCHAYSDSVTDVPLLRAVGHPVAVNPDRELARVAQAEGWEIRRFHHTVAMGDGRSVPVGRRAVAVAGAAGVLGATTGGLWWWHRSRSARSGPAGTLDRADQMVRTFLAATAARATSAMRTSSFFMDGEPSAVASRAVRAARGLVAAGR
jgi:HAD superfamily hydrolase (TIGR01490 family)